MRRYHKYFKLTLEFESEKKKILDSIASEEEKKKDIQEVEEVKKEETKTSTDSSALFNEIYEKHIGSKVSLNVSLIFYVNSINHIHI